MSQLESLKVRNSMLTSDATLHVNELYLQTIAALGLFADDIENGIDQFGTFSVVTFGPVVTSTRLSENEVIRSEQLAERSRSNGIHRARL